MYSTYWAVCGIQIMIIVQPATDNSVRCTRRHSALLLTYLHWIGGPRLRSETGGHEPPHWRHGQTGAGRKGVWQEDGACRQCTVKGARNAVMLVSVCGEQ